MPSLDHGGLTLHWVERGAPLQVPRDDIYLQGGNAPILAIHSGALSSRQWTRLAIEVGHRAPFLAPDLFGCGASSPWPSESFSYDDDATALSDLMRHIGRPVHLVGHSYGGFLALRLALRHPALVESLCVYEPVAFSVLRPEWDRYPELEELGPLLRDHATDEAFAEAFVDWWQGPGSWQKMALPERKPVLRSAHKAFLEAKSLLSDETPLATYESLDVPTLVLAGRASPRPAIRVCELLAGAIPQATLEVFEGLPHMGPITHADVVNPRILKHVFRER